MCVNSVDDLFKAFTEMIEIFVPTKEKFAAEHEDLFSSLHKTEIFIDRSYTLQDNVCGQL